MPTSCKPEAVIDSELFVHWNPLFPPSPQIVRHCCISDSVDSVEQPCTGALIPSGNKARMRAPQPEHRQSWARCSVTTRAAGSGRSNTWRALWPALMASVIVALQAVHDGG